jgi:hypothetical protein
LGSVSNFPENGNLGDLSRCQVTSGATHWRQMPPGLHPRFWIRQYHLPLEGAEMADATLANQQTLLKNQESIKKNQEEILKNQREILENQKSILAATRRQS